MSSNSTEVSRRTALGIAAGLAASPFAGSCASPGGGPPDPAAQGEISDVNPLGAALDKPVEIVVFDGGFGDEFATAIHEPMLTARHPGLSVRHVATKEIAKTLQPRYAGGTPPEVVDNDGADRLDLGALSADGQLADLAPLLDAPAWDRPGKKVRDVLPAAAIDVGTFDGKFCAVHYNRITWGIWYSRSLFARHGWEVPGTWDELLALCDRIRQAGIAPFTYAGKYPEYALEPLLTTAAKAGGPDVLRNIDNLADGAWLAEPVRRAAAAWQEIGLEYLLPGTAGLDHTESQARQNAGEVAMLPCGSWLENEQRNVTPAGFEYAMFPVPPLSASDALPAKTVHAGFVGAFFVSAHSANPRGGMEYLRAMLSAEGATRYTELVRTLTVLDETASGRLTPGLRSAVDALAASGSTVVGWRFDSWYRELLDEGRAVTGELMSGRLSPVDFGRRMQRKADALVRDTSVKKFRR
ncbi:N-acetylglucosamine/diacetylchitobiose ABC transporter substrate-binding protein [Amycolatopsis sp. NPDC004169]|uniref:N-acetylglucosamine/diacetylchitobiose ABC transporter substrate-binding protein n=1 Tax=Amycolatopsis sp. NPDC004169 TaxID=3154453 RepID=UPI0033BC0E1B